MIHSVISSPPPLSSKSNKARQFLFAKDFAFALEESLNQVFEIIHRHRLKVSLIQSSAVSISVCVDNTRYVEKALEEMKENFRISYNENLSLLTIRGKNDAILERAKAGKVILLSQTTRRMARLVVESSMEIQ